MHNLKARPQRIWHLFVKIYNFSEFPTFSVLSTNLKSRLMVGGGGPVENAKYSKVKVSLIWPLMSPNTNTNTNRARPRSLLSDHWCLPTMSTLRRCYTKHQRNTKCTKLSQFVISLHRWVFRDFIVIIIIPAISPVKTCFGTRVLCVIMIMSRDTGQYILVGVSSIRYWSTTSAERKHINLLLLRYP